ncbi:MAG TPA: hypothetical protein VIM14_19115 [Polyangia bacterium]
MLRNALAVPFIVALACSCASAPVQEPAPIAVAPKPAVAVAAPAPEVEPTVTVASTGEKQRDLKAGECEESFDCTDTVGFPPAGQRWTCEQGKCGHAKLPDINPEASAAATDTTADNSKDAPKAKKTKRRHN